jgi:hypothetical protein
MQSRYIWGINDSQHRTIVPLRGAIKRRVDSRESLNYIWAKVYLVGVNALMI